MMAMNAHMAVEEQDAPVDYEEHCYQAASAGARTLKSCLVV